MSDPSTEVTSASGARHKRTKEEYERDLANCGLAHTANETSRDTFLAVAHTAVFVSAVSFAADLEGKTLDWFWLGVVGLSCNVAGLIAQTISYPAASHLIGLRYKRINDPAEPKGLVAAACNHVALWTFPVSIIAIFGFVLLNLGASMIKPGEPIEEQVKEALEKGVTVPPRAPQYETGIGRDRGETGVLPSPRAPEYQPDEPVDVAPEAPTDESTPSGK